MSRATGGAAVILMAGSRWENTTGTDHRLARALAQHMSVLWVDPPVPAISSTSRALPPLRRGYALDGIGENLVRLRVLVAPGFTKPGMRSVAKALVGRGIRQAIHELAVVPLTTLLMSPREVFPRDVAGLRLLHVTDDWPAGARLMGLTRRHVVSNLRANMEAADFVTAVSPPLAETLGALTHNGPAPVVLPNGCSMSTATTGGPERDRATVGLIGQLNERLDLDLLDELAATGIDVEVIGPRREHDPLVTARMDRFLGQPNVRWLGEMTEAELSSRLQTLTVGITPYLDNAFNRASFPLKTLDYLAAGLPVVSTGLPAVHWLDTPLIQVGATRQQFVELVQYRVAVPLSTGQREERRAFARQHTWEARAEQLLGMLGEKTRS